jgi:hypothetical protein
MTRFQHTFATGITGTMVFDPALHYCAAECRVSPDKHWSRTPSPSEFDSMFSEYKEWAKVVHAEISAIVQGPIAHLLQDSSGSPPSWELWFYLPDGTRRLAQRGVL